MTSRPLAVWFGMVAAALLAGLYAVGALWRPIPNIVVAAVFLCALLGLLRGSRSAGFGGALFLLTGAISAGWMIRRLPAPIIGPANLAVLGAIALIFAILLFLAGRALPRDRGIGPRAAWVLFSIAMPLFTLTHHQYTIVSGGMENTIVIGDVLYFRLTGASHTPFHGEIVVFRYPPNPEQVFIKRIAAIPGDRVHLENKTLFLNGVAQNEPFAVHRTSYIDPFRDNFPSQPNLQLVADWAGDLAANTSGRDIVVPPGKYFVLGDNRDDSLDSRYWGFVPRDAILGTPSFICFSAGQRPGGEQLTAPVLLTPSRIRWGRLGRSVR